MARIFDAGIIDKVILGRFWGVDNFVLRHTVETGCRVTSESGPRHSARHFLDTLASDGWCESDRREGANWTARTGFHHVQYAVGPSNLAISTGLVNT
jgi:hypothetical protein